MYYRDFLTLSFPFSVSGHHIHIPNNLLSQMQPEVLEILELEPSWDFNIINLEKATAKRWVGNREIICFSLDLIQFKYQGGICILLFLSNIISPVYSWFLIFDEMISLFDIYGKKPSHAQTNWTYCVKRMWNVANNILLIQF